MPPTLQAALVPLIVMILTYGAARMKISTPADGLWASATAIAAVITGGVGVFLRWKDQKKIKRAEAIVPGITSIPKGSEVSASVSVNEPNDDPPREIVKQTPNSP